MIEYEIRKPTDPLLAKYFIMNGYKILTTTPTMAIAAPRVPAAMYTLCSRSWYKPSGMCISRTEPAPLVCDPRSSLPTTDSRMKSSEIGKTTLVRILLSKWQIYRM